MGDRHSQRPVVWSTVDPLHWGYTPVVLFTHMNVSTRMEVQTPYDPFMHWKLHKKFTWKSILYMYTIRYQYMMPDLL